MNKELRELQKMIEQCQTKIDALIASQPHSNSSTNSGVMIPHRKIPKGKHIIAIRAGHGGIHPVTGEYTTKNAKQWRHPGMTNLHGPAGVKDTFYEGVWNRTIAQMVYEGLWAKGVPCKMIHHEYEDLRLYDQVQKINHIHKNENPIALLLELHSNASGSHKARGFEVYTTPGETKSDRYAEILFNEVTSKLPVRPRTDMSDGDKDREKNFTMIAKTWCPAILPEFLFFDNSEDIKLIMDPTIMKKYVQCLCHTAKVAYDEYK